MALFFSPAYADSIQTEKDVLTDCLVMRAIGGRLIVRIGEENKSIALADIKRLDISGSNTLSAAEEARASQNWARAGQLYVEAGRTTNKTIQTLTQARLIGVLDARGQWTDAVTLFLKIYATEPGQAAWDLRPVNLPDEKSVMLPESASLIEAKMRERALQTVLAQRHMKQLLVDIYLQMNDPRAAVLARQLQQGIDGAPTDRPQQSADQQAQIAQTIPATQPSAASQTLRKVEELLQRKQYAEALAAIESAPENSEGASAAELMVMRGDVLAASDQHDDALLTYLRVPAMSDAGSWGGAALLKAANLQKKLGRHEAATNLYKEVVQKYPDTLWAKEAVKRIKTEF